MIDLKICTRCEKDTASEITTDCNVCRVYGLCMDCARIHRDTCLARIRTRRVVVPMIPDPMPTPASVPAPARSSAFDSPLLWIVLMGGAFAALMARILP